MTIGETMTKTAEEASLSGEEGSGLPASVTDVPRELLKSFPHTKKVGNYLLGKTLGEGSFAKVKEGLHILTGEKVAVKVVDKKKAKEDPYVRKNLRREGKLLSAVRHRHVVQLFEVMETENSYYLVTELCRGGDLMEIICIRRRLDERTVKKFIRQILLAVQHLHSLGILHRDLKVENLLLDENQNIKIIDFGLSNSVRVGDGGDAGGSSSAMPEFCVTQCGSPAYAAPELLGNAKYGPMVDIWSIGVNMYAMLVGSLPFTVEPFNIKALHRKMLNGEINTIPAHLSTHCKEFLKRILTPDPAKRITIPEALKHAWIADGARGDEEVAERRPLTADDLDPNILRHMSQTLGFRLTEILRLVASNTPHGATATYHLLCARLNAHRTAATRAKSAPNNVQEKKRSTGARDLIELVPIDEHLSDKAPRSSQNPVTSRKLGTARSERQRLSIQRERARLMRRRTENEQDATTRQTENRVPGNLESLDLQIPPSKTAPAASRRQRTAQRQRNSLSFERQNEPRMPPLPAQPLSERPDEQNSPAPSQSNCTEASSSAGSRSQAPSSLPPPQRRLEPHPPERGGTTSDLTHGEARQTTAGGPQLHSSHLVHRANSSLHNTVVENGQSKFTRKSSFNSTSNSLNSSLGSSAQTKGLRNLISLDYPAVPKLVSSPPAEPTTSPIHSTLADDQIISTTPRHPRLSALNPDLNKTPFPENSNKTFTPPKPAVDEDPLQKLLHKRTTLKRIPNLPVIDTSPSLGNKP